MYITSVKFKQGYRSFKVGESFDFANFTLLVGDQGCGKSTLLDLLQRHDKKIIDVSLTEDTRKNGVSTFYFDSEKMNPRINNPVHYSNIDGTNKGIGVGNALKARFYSHGEILSIYTVDALKKAKDCVVFIDEPESGLSLRNQFKLTAEITAATNRGCQVIVATHSLVLIQSTKDVLSLEHRCWMKSDEFIQANSTLGS